MANALAMTSRCSSPSRAGSRARRAPFPACAPLLVTICATLCLLTDVGAASGGRIVRENGRRVLEVTGDDLIGEYELPDVFILAGTDTVTVGVSLLERDADYSIDYGRGLFTLALSLPDTALVSVSYRYFPISLDRLYRHAVLESLRELPEGFAEGAQLLAPEREGLDRPPVASGLRVGGAKTFGVTVGSNRDATLEQSLRLSVNGRITRDVSVNAYLTDQNTPLVPEGDTEELRSLDEVMIEIESELVRATMGDLNLRIEGGTLSDFRRELSGAAVRVGRDATNIVVAGARAEGEFRSFTFRGTDGKQGAYLLSGGAGSVGISVVAGSETIWLNGQRLRRGRDNDYFIDYTAGAIEFTERRPITSDHEITVDYEQTTGDYQRDIYAARGEGELASGALALGVSYFREVDDKDASGSTALSASEVAVLEAAGDDIALAHDEGVDSVGVGSGDYVMIGEGIFEYAGPDSGAYDLRFEREDGGDYEFDFIGDFYVYVGPGEGSYQLGRDIPLPTDHGLLAVDGRLEFGDSGHVVVEAALSDLDRNTFSGLDDDNNAGNAEIVEAQVPSIGIPALDDAKLDLTARARRVAGTFQSIGRFSDVRYEEEWELEGLALGEEELLTEAESLLTLEGGGSLALSYARLERGGGIESWKARYALEGKPNANSRLWSRGRFVDLSVRPAGAPPEDRERTLVSAGADYKLGRVRPGVAYRHDERTRGDGGERYDEYEVSLESAGSGAVSFGARYAYRLTDRAEGNLWRRASTTTTEEYRLGLTGSEKLSFEGTVTRREIDAEEGLGESGSRYDLANVRLGHRSLDGALAGELRYSVTATEVEERERIIYEEAGVQIIRIISTGRYLPVTDLSTSMKWALRFRKSSRTGAGMPEPTPWRRFLAALSLETDLKLRESTTTDNKRGLYLLDPSVIQSDDTIKGEITGRHTVRYTLPSGALSVRTALITRDDLDRSYANASDTRTERKGTVDVRLSRPGGLTYRIEADLGRRERNTAGVGDSYEIGEGGILGEVQLRRSGGLDAKLTASLSRQEDSLAGLDANLFRVTPGATYRIAGRGAVSANVSRTEVVTDETALPLYLAQGLRPGVTTDWRLTGDYRFNRFLTGSLSYVGERRPEGEARHTFDLRVSAFF